MKDFLKKVGAFIGKYWHRAFTFTVGLVFIAAICVCVGLVANRIYRAFVPNNIYTDSSYSDLLYGGTVYESDIGENVETGSAEFFENYIYNFIKQDLPDFGDPLELNDEYIISYGIWQAISLNNTQSVYTYNSKGGFRVPRKDVEMFSFYCFDFARKIDHRTVDVCGKFRYNVFNGLYSVTAAGVDSYLIPEVLNVEQGENDTYILTVDCYEENMMSAEDPKNDPANFRKRVVITLQDMGIQSYDSQTGNPISRYMFLSMNTQNDVTSPDTDTGDLDLN